MKVGTAHNVINSKINSKINSRNLDESVQNSKGRDSKDSQKKHAGSIYAGDLNVNQDHITNRKALGQKQAIKKILDSFSRELNMDNSIQEMKNRQDSLNADISQYKDKMEELRKMKEDIQNSYGVSEDSAEQKDLDILIKSRNNPETLTGEEKTRLENMGPLTDYQKEIFEANKIEAYWSNKTDAANSEVAFIDKTLVKIGIARLKSHPVLDAKKAAEDIMDAASKEIVGMLMDEAVEETDKKLEDNTKTDGSQAEGSQTEAATQTEKKPEETAGTDGESIESIAVKQEKVLREVKKQAQKINLSLEDLKGILVDAQS